MALSSADLPTMYTLLRNSLSGDVSVRKPAETALLESENRPGFCSCLLELITAEDLVAQVDVRLMASLYFKNSINRYWRNRRNSFGISNEEKAHLRQKLLSHFREENSQIATSLAVIISKVARIDYPKDWPDIFSVLAHRLQSADVLASHRICMVFFRTLKELSSKRLTSDQKNFAEISSHFFDYSWHLWQSDVKTILHGFSSVSQSLNPTSAPQQLDDLFLICERWLLCLKIIRQLVISGFQSDANCLQEVQPVKDVAPMLLNAIQSFLPYYSIFQEQQHKLWDFTNRACIKLMKVLVAMMGRHPYSFADKCVLPPVMGFCLNAITNPDPYIIAYDQFLIQCMVMVKNVLECKEYRPSITGRVMDGNAVTLDQRKKSMSNAISGILASLLPDERIILLCNIMIRRYFVLSQRDLEAWHQNPESFHHEQDMVQWSEKLRPCAEALYIVLFETHSQLLGPVVVSILKEAMAGCPTSVTEITQELLLKDAAYGAAAYVYYELSSHLSFSDWFNGALSVELLNDHPNLPIIHRKVALILGQWVSEVKDDIKKSVYCALIRLLQDKDLSVRLAACRSLGMHIQDAGFSEHDFIDLLPHCCDLCFQLADDVQEFDSKVQVLNLISVLIGQISEVNLFANKLMPFFQKVWEESSGESLLQIQVLTSLKNLVVALGYQSPICYSVLLPILQKGIDINDPDELNLLEDSMLLWKVTMSHAPSMVPQLSSFFPCLVQITERSFEYLEISVKIIEDYIMLGGSDFLNMHAANIAKLLDLIVGNVNDKGLLSTFPIVDVLIQCFPMEVPPLISSTLQQLVLISLSGGDDHNPSRTAVRASSASILARILVMNSNYLAQLTSDPALLLVLQKAGLSVTENILLSLVDIWLEVDNVSPIQRKTIGFALSIILTLRMPQVLDKLDQILSACTSVLVSGVDDTNEEESSDNFASSVHHGDDIPASDLRKRQIKLSDPINKMSLETSLRDNLQTCAGLHGESFNSAISRVHPAAFAQLKQALKMP